MNEYIVLDELLIKLAALLGASLLIERVLTFLSVAINRLFVFQYAGKDTRTEKLREQMAREREAEKEDQVIKDQKGKDNDPNEVAFNPSLPEDKKRNSGFDVLPIRPLKKILNDEERYRKYRENNTIRKEFWMQVLGALLAIILCMVMQFSIWEFFYYAVNGAFPAEPSTFGYIFTGIIIGSGSKPINFLMNFIASRKIVVDREEVKQEALAVPEPETGEPETEKPVKEEMPPASMDVQPVSIEERVGFEYDGGDRPGRLENTHIYPNGVDMLVYHHTAMHSDAPFREVVKEFDRKGWLTGYHCVVFPDGTIRVLCRWDRFGNHALPFNRKSFGIAFQGNFETRPGVPFSNHDGRFGMKKPRQPQLKASARVVALYTLMQDVPFAFPEEPDENDPKGIMPHNKIANKSCPGNNFPYQDFMTMVGTFYNEWKNDESFNKALEAFMQKPMIAINNA
ncbi:MAG: N-acetylmuramoyl-L-alanine amidase [Bacteroidota bacterium]